MNAAQVSRQIRRNMLIELGEAMHVVPVDRVLAKALHVLEEDEAMATGATGGTS